MTPKPGTDTTPDDSTPVEHATLWSRRLHIKPTGFLYLGESKKARGVSILLPVLVTIILLALVLFPILSQTASLAQVITYQSIMGSALLLVLLYGLYSSGHSQMALHRSEERYKLVAYATNDIVWERDLSSNQIEWNRSIQRVFGYSAEQVGKSGAWWEEQIHPDDREEVIASIQGVIINKDNFWSKEYRFRRADGAYAHVFDRGYFTSGDHGKPVHIVGAMMDITAWRTAEQELAEERNLLRTLVDQLPDRIYVKDTECRFVLKNLADARAMQAGSTDEVVGKTDFDYYPPELAEKYFSDDQAVIKSGQSLINYEEPGLGENGAPRWVLTTKMPLRDRNGQIIGLVGIGHDITERRGIEKTLQRTNQQLSAWVSELERRSREMSLLNEMSDLLQSCSTEKEAYLVISEIARLLFYEETGGLYITSASHNIVELVASWGIGMPAESVFKPEDCWGLRLGRLHVVEKSAAADNQAKDAPNLFCNHVAPLSLEASLCVPLVAQGNTLGLLHVRHTREEEGKVLTDEIRWFTEARQQLVRTVAASIALALANLRLRDTLRQQSIRDPLTGLFNRRYMEETIEREISRVIRSKQPLGIIMMDVDHFKRFNDTYGHEAGDLVLHEIGACLRSQIRGEDIACRYGGEEFILIMPGAPLEVVQQRAGTIRKGIKSLNIKFRDQPLKSVTVSLGIATYPENGPTAEAVIRAADSALHRAKKAGRDRVVTMKLSQVITK